jgi:uncharacterized RDD family membrane protein YckC
MATTPRGIVTPEAVVLDFETAGISSRAIARLIDALIQIASLFVLGGALGMIAGGSGGSVGIVLAIIGVAAVVIGYPILCEVLMHGGSPGKAVFGLRVVTVEGAPSAPWHAFIRSVVGIVDFLIPPGGLCAVTSALLTEKGQRLGDLAAGTIVLRERNAAAPAMAIWFRPPAGFEAYARTLDVSAVTDEQFAVVRSFLLRVHELSPEARVALALRLARPISAAMHHQAPPGVHPESFLVCVAAAHQQRRRAQAPPPMPPPPSAPLPPPPPPPPPAGRPLVAPIGDDPGRYAPPS